MNMFMSVQDQTMDEMENDAIVILSGLYHLRIQDTVYSSFSVYSGFIRPTTFQK